MTVRDVLCPSRWGNVRRPGAPTGRTVLSARKERPEATGHGVCAWPALGGAIISEVSATLALRQALNQPGFYVMVGVLLVEVEVGAQRTGTQHKDGEAS